MKTKDLKIGELYAYRDGKYGSAQKARVLEVNVERSMRRRRGSRLSFRPTETARNGVRICFFRCWDGKEQEKSSVVLVRHIVSTWNDHEKAKAQKKAAEAAHKVRHEAAIKLLEEVLDKVLGGQGRLDRYGARIIIEAYNAEDILHVMRLNHLSHD